MAVILVVEDNESLREAVVAYLELDDHKVVQLDRVKGVIEALKTDRADLIVLDVMLPDGDGFLLARRIRAGGNQAPILFLTARAAESDRITGFEVGGDDYMVKPFSPKELVLRVKAILKRSGPADAPSEESRSAWKLGRRSLEIDTAAHRVRIDGKDATLTAAEWKILRYLADNTGIVVDRMRLLEECLDSIAEGSERTIDTHVKNLRGKLGDDWIETVRGFGYRFAGSPG